MKQRLLIALLTAFGFVAGFGARMLTESGPAVPPPPAPGTEFVRSSTATPPPADSRPRPGRTYSEKDRARILSQIEEIRPQIDNYRRRIEEIAGEFDRELAPILTAEQREKFDARQKRDAERRAKNERQASEPGTLSDEQIFELQQRPLWYALWNVAIQWRLDRLNHDYKLDQTQQAKAKLLLQARREKFLALVDETPPPSITLSQLVTQADKLKGHPQK